MDLSTYKSNALKTLSVKPAKDGLRHMAKNTLRTHLAHGIVGFSAEVGEYMESLYPYILGNQMTPAVAERAFDEMGDVGYYLVVLAKVAKVKVPGTGKKTKLVGMTRTEAILSLHQVSIALLGLHQKSLYKGVQPTPEEQAVVDAQRLEAIQKLVAYAITLYWPLCFDMFGVPPADVLQANIVKLSARYPDGYFSMTAHEARDKKKEAQAVKAAAKVAKEQDAAKAAEKAGTPATPKSAAKPAAKKTESVQAK